MALRDLFDSDSRSKQQLRNEIQRLAEALALAKNEIFALNQQIISQAKCSLDLEAEKSHTADAQLKVSMAEARVQELESLINAIKLEQKTIEQREATLYKNFAELQRREQLLALNEEQLTARGRTSYVESQPPILLKMQQDEEKIQEIAKLKAELATTARESRESKFLFDLMFEPYRDRAIREGRPVVDVQVADLQSKLFEANEKLRDLAENGAPELRSSEQEIASLRRKLEHQSNSVKNHERKIWLLQGKLNESEKLVSNAEKRVEGARIVPQAELEKLNRENSGLTKILKERDQELKELRQNLQVVRDKTFNLDASMKAAMQKKDSEMVRWSGHSEVEQSARIYADRRFEFPEKWLNSRVLSWMLWEASPSNSGVESGYLGLIGSGPWDRAVFGELLETKEFSLWNIPDAEVRHLVVGTEGWTTEELELQIASVEGEVLRVYSQEMWFAFLATGRDPFDAEDEELLMAFAEGHPALQYLLSRDICWPTVSSSGIGPDTELDLSDFGVLESPMHLLDYRVGATSPHDEDTRREILKNCFHSTNLPFGPDCSASYRARWGSAKSAQRLFRMALHIKHVLDGPSGRDYRKPQATADWLSDLEWLKETFFRKSQHKFVWPGDVR